MNKIEKQMMNIDHKVDYCADKIKSGASETFSGFVCLVKTSICLGLMFGAAILTGVALS